LVPHYPNRNSKPKKLNHSSPVKFRIKFKHHGYGLTHNVM
jgi:hypothetical protein